MQEAWRGQFLSGPARVSEKREVYAQFNHSQALQQQEAPNSNKNHRALENTTQCDLPGRPLLPARLANEIRGGACRKPSDNYLEPSRSRAPSRCGLAAPPNLRGTLLRVPPEVNPHPDHARAGVRAVRWSLKVNNQRGLEYILFFTSTERTESVRARRTTEPARDPSAGPPRG